MEEIWKPAINIWKEMAPEKDEHLTLLLNGSQSEKSTLAGCKINMIVHLFNGRLVKHFSSTATSLPNPNTRLCH